MERLRKSKNDNTQQVPDTIEKIEVKQQYQDQVFLTDESSSPSNQGNASNNTTSNVKNEYGRKSQHGNLKIEEKSNLKPKSNLNNFFAELSICSYCCLIIKKNQRFQICSVCRNQFHEQHLEGYSNKEMCPSCQDKINNK
eukprot:TRINITY_DN14654_c0_g1_i1.p2 TRINITY_DN14654_c0_g1~~TRINITY_DN14654_c0_g1_i1.p2  ORF type:complete len:140 (-),score=27.49 TRINITY_DN14654_c0_g1_i1:3-422(-)